MDILSRTEVFELSKTKKLIGFGAGILGSKTQRYLDGKLAYFLDNEEKKWGSLWEGIPVRDFSALDEEDHSSVAIIICSEHFEMIAQQLRSIYPDMEMYRTPLLKEFAIFDRLLNCSRKLLVSSYGATGGLYLVNGHTESHKLLCKGSFRGILHYKDRLIVATEHGSLWAIETFDPFRYSILYEPEEISQMHGLVYWEKENVIIGAEAEPDQIAFFDADSFSRVDTLSIRNDNCAPNTGAFHINDLHIQNNTLFLSLCSCSGWFKQGIYDGCICAINLDEKGSPTPIITGLLFPHSIKFIDGSLYLLESMSGSVRRGTAEITVQLNGFIRGMDGGDGILYIGQARNRRLNEAIHIHSPISMDSGIYVVDIHSKVYRFIKLPEMCDVYSVMDLEKVDIPAVKGISSNI